MKRIEKAISHFVDFHQGKVNVAGHILGFIGIFYSIYALDWVLFAISLVVLEFGHVYNHFAGIKPYDLRAKVTFWRVFLFILTVGIFYLVSQFIR